jgi:CBS domain containing-hemolysin-like protein
LVFALAGRVPPRGEILHHPTGYDFEVIDADPRRIKRVRIRSAKAVEKANTDSLQAPSA